MTHNFKLDKDFIIYYGVIVNNSNPNGDPGNNNVPRTLENGHGYITDVALKQKIRHNLHENAYKVYGINDGNSAQEKNQQIAQQALNSDKKVKEIDSLTFQTEALTHIDIRLFGGTFASGSDGVKINGTKACTGCITMPKMVTQEKVRMNTEQIARVYHDGKESVGTFGERTTIIHGLYTNTIHYAHKQGAKNGVTTQDLQTLTDSLEICWTSNKSAARPEVEEKFLVILEPKNSSYIRNDVVKKIIKITKTEENDYELQVNQEKADELNIEVRVILS